MRKTGNRRFDPDRRRRIIGAALDVIATVGVTRTTHRLVAESAGVPLGSMTYHFDSLEHLLTDAFTQFMEESSNWVADRLGGIETTELVRSIVVDIILAATGSSRYLLLSHELYAYANRNRALQDIMRNWMTRSRQELERHFDPLTARALDAFIEGMIIHNSVELFPGGRSAIEEVVGRLIPDRRKG